MKEYMASVRNKETGKIEVLRMEYESKKAFAYDIRKNGYTVRFISTPEDFDKDCAKYHHYR